MDLDKPSVNKNLSNELREKFEIWKKKSNFESSFEDLNNIFFIEDYILSCGFVSSSLSRMLCARIRDTFYGWVQQIHSWLMPNPYSIISTSEGQIFDNDEKNELEIILRRIMALISKNIIIGLTKNYEEESKFVDTSVKLWKDIHPCFVKYSLKIEESWRIEKIEEKHNFENCH